MSRPTLKIWFAATIPILGIWLGLHASVVMAFQPLVVFRTPISHNSITTRRSQRLFLSPTQKKTQSSSLPTEEDKMLVRQLEEAENAAPMKLRINKKVPLHTEEEKGQTVHLEEAENVVSTTQKETDGNDEKEDSFQTEEEKRLILQLEEAENAAKMEQNELELKTIKAREAVQTLEKARKQLGRLQGSSPPPLNRRARMEVTDAGTLEILCPRKGFSSDDCFSAAFSIAWFSAIIPATFVGPAPLLSRVVLLPFWAAGGMVGKEAVVQPYRSSLVSIGKYAWSVKSRYLGKTIKKTEGATTDLSGAVVEEVAVINGVAQYELRLYSQKEGVVPFGHNLSREEQSYLAEEINNYLAKLRQEEKEEKEKDNEQPDDLAALP